MMYFTESQTFYRLFPPFVLFYFFYLLVVVEAASSKPATIVNSMTSKRSGEILLIFSDLDGTLIHYPEKIPEDSDKILKLPTSSTGMKGIISSKTLTRAQEVRERGSKFILVSGMRASTLFKRLPYLPRADAYAVEVRKIFAYLDLIRDKFSLLKGTHFFGLDRLVVAFSILGNILRII